jgi:hypothetical protein
MVDVLCIRVWKYSNETVDIVLRREEEDEG